MATPSATALAHALARYHATHFPARLVYAFALRRELGHREWAFHVAEAGHDSNRGAEPLVWRNQSFDSASELEEFLRSDRRHVVRVELGALYSVAPRYERLYKVGAFALARELVFDIDASSYDEGAVGFKRKCCRASDVCARCWPLLACAASVIDHVLRAQLGFARVLWLYSGGRGVHAWVCDERAATLADGARRIVEHTCAVLARPVEDGTRPPSGERALRAIMETWRRIYAEAQGVSAVEPEAMAPRIDAAVSAQRSHLLRAPFSAHARTGSVALPLPLDVLQRFDPQKAPHVSELGSASEGAALFRESVRYFEEFTIKRV